MIIRGEKTLSTVFSEKDITDKYISWLNDEKTTRYSNQRFKNHSVESCQRYLESFAASNNIFLKINDLKTMEMIGTMTAFISIFHKTANIGILVGPKNWGKGYGKDAFSALTQYLLVELSIRKVTAGTLRCNESMISVIKCAGMTLEAILKDEELVNDEPQDMLYFSKFSTKFARTS